MSQPKLAYLAPEIPGLSSTFVYNEIFALEDEGFEIETFSVHRSGDFSKDEKLQAVVDKTFYLYEKGIASILKANIAVFLSQPLRYLCKLLMCFGDILSVITQPRLCAGVFYRFLVGGLLAGELKRKQIEHLHIHFAHIPTDIGMYGCALAGISYSVTAHANDIYERGWLIKPKIARSKFFATISNFNIKLLTEMGGDPSKLTIVRCGVNSALFKSRPSKERSEPVVFGLLGRLVEKKGTHILIDACSKLKKTHANFVVQIVGNGPLQEQLETQAATLGLENEIQFLGAKPHSEIAPWLDNLDYFVLPCVRDSQGDMDGIPVALMEAMLKGVPVISSDISGVPELVIHNDTGLAAKNGDADDLAKILEQAINEPAESLHGRIEKAKTHVMNEYDLTANAKRLAKLF